MLELHANGDSQKQRKDYSKDNSVAEAHLNAIHMMKELHVKKLKNVLGLEKELLLEKYSSKRVYHVKKMEKQKFVVKKFSNANQKLIVKLLKTVAKKRLRNQKENSLLVLLLENPMLKHSKRKFFKTSLKDHSNLLKIDMFQFIQ